MQGFTWREQPEEAARRALECLQFSVCFNTFTFTRMNGCQVWLHTALAGEDLDLNRVQGTGGVMQGCSTAAPVFALCPAGGGRQRPV